MQQMIFRKKTICERKEMAVDSDLVRKIQAESF